MADPNAKPGTGRDDKRAGEIDESDLDADRMGNNQLQGNDQASVRNERQVQPDARQEADASPIESFEKMDKDHRAREELGKGNRGSGQGSGA